MIKSYLFCFSILLISVLIETAVLSNLLFLPAIPDLLLICILYFSVNKGSLFGEVSGFVSGVFIDFLSGSPFGLNCLYRTIIGYIAGFFKKMLNLKSVFVSILIGFIGTILKAVLIHLVSLFFPNYVNTYNLFSMLFLFELIMNSILTPFIFKFLNCFEIAKN